MLPTLDMSERSLTTNSSASCLDISARSFRSAPAQNTPGRALPSTTARTDSSREIRSTVCSSCWMRRMVNGSLVVYGIFIQGVLSIFEGVAGSVG